MIQKKSIKEIVPAASKQKHIEMMLILLKVLVRDNFTPKK
jgi:hypothetical protein